MVADMVGGTPPGEFSRRRSIGGWGTLGVAILVMLSLLGAGPAPPVKPPPAVVLLSMDGVRWDYPLRDHLPTFRAMAESGLSAGRLTPPFPSLTFPSHATLATGVAPSAHGIVANAFLTAPQTADFGRARGLLVDGRAPSGSAANGRA
jgi:hypothetical protein